MFENDLGVVLERRAVLHWVKTMTGLRASARLNAATDIVFTFAAAKLFNRSEVLATLAQRYYWKCLDRAVDALLAGRCVYEVDGVPLTKGGGRTYEIRLDNLVGGAAQYRGAPAMGQVSADGMEGHDDFENHGFERQDWDWDFAA